MAFKIDDNCVGCGTCEGNCPTYAVFEDSGKYYIDPEKCVECGMCLDGCPTGAIVR